MGKVISSHTGRKTGVSILRGMGIDPGIVQRWMLVSSIKVVEYYRDHDYISNKAMRDLFDWMKTKKKWTGTLERKISSEKEAGLDNVSRYFTDRGGDLWTW